MGWGWLFWDAQELVQVGSVTGPRFPWGGSVRPPETLGRLLDLSPCPVLAPGCFWWLAGV